MRGIKFRGLTVLGEWNYGDLTISQQKINNIDAGAYVSSGMGLPYAYKVMPETVSEFTGLKDKNGTEIYEGDIVAKFDLNDPSFRSEVVFRNGAFGYVHEDQGFISFAGNSHFHWVDRTSQKIEVVGNIYENPDLTRDESETPEQVEPDPYYSRYGEEPGENM